MTTNTVLKTGTSITAHTALFIVTATTVSQKTFTTASLARTTVTLTVTFTMLMAVLPLFVLLGTVPTSLLVWHKIPALFPQGLGIFKLT